MFGLKSDKNLIQIMLEKSILFPILFCLNQIILHFNYDKLGKSFFLPNQIDEFSYLDQLRFSYEGVSNASFYKEHDTYISFYENITQNVSSIIDFFFSYLLIFFHPYTAGFILDIFCIFISFYLLLAILKLFCKNNLICNIGAFIGIVAPNFVPFDNYLNLSYRLNSFLLNPSLAKYIDSPVTRSLYTQLSFCLFLIGLYFYLKGVLKQKDRLVYFSAVITGISLNFYFFAWESLFFILNLINLFYLFKLKKDRIKTFLLFPVISSLFSLPGISMIVFLKSSLITPCSKSISNYYYFSPELLITFIVISFVTYTLKRRTNDNSIEHISLFYKVISIVVLGYFVIVNLQPLYGCFLSPFRIGYYFLPIYASFSIILVLSFFKIFKNYFHIGIGLILFLLVAHKLFVVNISYSNKAKKNSKEFVNLVNYINSKDFKKKSFAIWPGNLIVKDKIPSYFATRLTPTKFRSYTNTYLLSQFWIFPRRVSIPEMAEREMLLNWMFTGNEKDLFIPCNLLSTKEFLPGDILELTWSAQLLLREDMCDYLKVTELSICELLNKYEVEYLLNDIEIDLPKLKYYNKIWSSEDKKMLLYQFNKAKAITSECSNVN